MASEKEQNVPVWDGSARSWRRYTREVCWYVRATPVEKRRYCATKLVSRLKGPARLLAMSWTTMEFDHVNGVRDLLQRLATSPLVRQTLPNAAATCQQYFNFRRDAGEQMNTFLVREALGYSEFVEALLLLYEDKQGVQQHEKNFDLPEELPRDDWQDWWHDATDEPEPDAAPTSPSRPTGAAAATSSPTRSTSAAAGGDGTGMSPTRQSPRAVSFRSVGVPGSTVPPGFETSDINEFSLADSFVLGVLRGFRLLQAAGLSPEDKRDILASTKGSLEFDVVTKALQTLWDEQFLGRQASSMRSSMGNYFNEAYHASEEPYDYEWWNDETYENYWTEPDAWDSSWDSWQDAQYGQSEQPAEDPPPDDPALQDSLQAEREAEALALQAQRTWTEAQKATAALRRDRGFGQQRPPNDGKCFLCGGNHFARDCPDKFHPAYMKGKGKGKYTNVYAAEWEMADAYYMKGKGKPKGKGKGKSFNVVDMNAMWKGKGKSKNVPSCPAVNAYTAETQSFYGLELREPLEAHSTAATNMKPNLGLLDCGATASAGPETSVQKLISSVLAQDRGAAVTIAKYMRPYFRFGNGCWGQANFRVSITSKVSGFERTFHMYCLPDPKNGDQNNMVPVLLGMDHLSGKDCPESALTIDFNTGMALESTNPQPNVFQLPCNHKGHYIRDIVHYLTLGNSNHEGHPTIHVMEGETQSAELQTLEFHPAEFYDLHVADRVHDQEVLEKSRRQLLALHAHQHGRVDANAAASLASMCPRDQTDLPNSFASASCVPPDHVAGTSPKASSGCNHCCDAKSSTTGTGPGAHDGLRQQGSTCGSKSMALSRVTHTNEASRQCSRPVGALRSVQLEAPVHAQEGKPLRCNQSGEPCHGEAYVGPSSTFDGRLPSNPTDMPGDDQADRGGRSASGHHQLREGQACDHGICQGQGKSFKVVTFNDISGVAMERCGESGSSECRRSSTPLDGRGEEPDSTAHARAPGECQQRERDGLKYDNVLKNDFKSVDVETFKNANTLENDQVPAFATVPKNVKVPKIANKNIKPAEMTQRMAAKVMVMFTTMMAMASASLTSFSLDDRDGLWEIACAPHSWLSEAADRQGLRPRRINLQAGYDLYRKETWDHLRALRRRHRPRRLWFSLPCTFWCPWTSLNYAGPERQQLLEDHRRRERRVLWHVHEFLSEALDEDPDILVYYEWPHPCFGWKQKPLLAIQALFEQHGQEWNDCRIDGCRYGMVDSNNEFLKKKWMIKTNDELFHGQYRCKVCTGGHCHGRIEGRETQKSSYYPWKMVQSFARFWAQQTVSKQQLQRMNFHDVATVEDCDGGDLLAQDEEPPGDHSMPSSLPGNAIVAANPADAPSAAERERWQAKLNHFHRSSGHCSSRNLARIVKDANLESWKVRAALDFTCPICEGLRPGGSSSGNVPPAATHAQYGPWQALGLDASEWAVPGHNVKVKFLLLIDFATRLRMAVPLMEPYPITALRTESSAQVIEAVAKSWLGTYPKPEIIIPDNGMGFSAKEFADFCRDQNIELCLPAEKEPWAHGLVENAMRELKHTASAIQMDNLAQDPTVTLALAASALNSTEFVAGFSSHQWAFGRAYTISEEDRRLFAQLGERASFASMVAARQRAEDVATKTRAQRVLTRLNNSKARQPLRHFQIADLVKVWRKILPSDAYKGPRGGMKRTSRPGWIGPGRVVFTELLPHQDKDDPRRHIVWVLLQGKLFKCSVHSVRPVTPVERFHHDVHNREDVSKMKTLSDLVPNREFVDITDEIPDENEAELPLLPQSPDDTTVIPAMRIWGKKGLSQHDWKTIHRSSPLGLGVPDPAPLPGLGSAVGQRSPGLDRPSSSQPAGLDLPAEDIPVNNYDSDAKTEYEPESPVREPPEEPHPDAPDVKRVKINNYDLKWVEQLEQDAAQEAGEFDVFSALQETEEAFTISFDIDVETHRQRKALERNPVLFLTKKMNNAEVQLTKLTAEHRELFTRAKTKEVDSFLKNQAVRKCLNNEEIRRAVDSNRIIRARWVLTWKQTAPDEIESAKKEAQEDPKTVLTKDGAKKAKARIVLLGFQHPSLLDRSFKTAAPVQSMVGRNLLYLLATHHQWQIHGLDLATAFLQTQPTEADQEIWTTGVAELRTALGLSDSGIMRILRNIYGSTTAPRGLWLDLHKKLVGLGAVPILGERCLWGWFSSTEKDETGKFPKLLGAIGGHVDDFHVVGDTKSEEWQVIFNKVLSAYRWGTSKQGSYRHAGTDIQTVTQKNGEFSIRVNQDAYIETVMDVSIEPERWSQQGPLTKSEIAACRTALGALQWLAIQTQPQLCARCNLLLTEVVTNGTIETAREIQQMVSEVRADPHCLEFFKLPGTRKWTDVVFVSMGDQSHANRPQGDSTGGLLTLAAGPDVSSGKVVLMNLLAWRSWKLKRKAIGSNDAEVQSILEAEDQNFRVRMLWSELHGAGLDRPERRADLVESAENQACMVAGILCTDSRGGYDAIEVNEPPLLGLSNMRAALQAFQLRDNLKRVNCDLRWVASDYDLADAFTKKRGDSRVGLLKFLKSRDWSVAYLVAHPT